MKDNRKKWIDICRGLGVLSVLLIHSVPSAVRTESRIAVWVYEFGMSSGRQILFLLAGYTYALSAHKYRNTSAATYISQKFRKLIVPYIVYGALIVLIFAVAMRIPGISQLISEYKGYGIKASLIGMLYGNLPYAVHLWFIYDLFIMNLLSYFLEKTGKYRNYILYILAAAAWIYTYFMEWNGYIAYFNCMYFAIWYVWGITVPIEKIKTETLVVTGILAGVLGIFSQFAGIGKNLFLDFMIQNAFPLCFSCMFLIISRTISGKFANKLVDIGRRSFDIYLFQQPFLGAFVGIMLYKLTKLPISLEILITFCISLCATWCISLILDKTRYLKLFFGRLI